MVSPRLSASLANAPVPKQRDDRPHTRAGQLRHEGDAPVRSWRKLRGPERAATRADPNRKRCQPATFHGMRRLSLPCFRSARSLAHAAGRPKLRPNRRSIRSPTSRRSTSPLLPTYAVRVVPGLAWGSDWPPGGCAEDARRRSRGRARRARNPIRRGSFPPTSSRASSGIRHMRADPSTLAEEAAPFAGARVRERAS